MLCKTTPFLRLGLLRSASSSQLVRSAILQQPRPSFFLTQILGPWKIATFTTSSAQQKVPIQSIKELRTRTGAGLNDCRDALIETNLDIEKAIELLKNKGQASADRISKKTGEGVVLASNEGGQVVLAEINCDTDFVARTKDFRQFAQAVVDAATKADSSEGSNLLDTTSLLSSPFESETLATRRKSLEKILGESVVVARVLKIQPNKENGEVVGAYQHGENGKYAGAVTLRPNSSSPVSRDELQNIANKLAVHVVGFSPKSIEVEKGGETETALVEQEFSVYENHPPERTFLVKDVLNQVGAKVVKFVRWTRGESA